MSHSGSAAGRALLAALLLWAAPAAAAGEYLIGGGDVLQITVWKNTELSQTVTVRPDGMITLPLIRDVPASGLTAKALADRIAAELSAFVNAPNVTVTVASATNYRVYTHGAIPNGMYTLTSPMNALQLLTRAGGPSPDADLSQAFVVRGKARIPVDLEPRLAGDPAADTYPALEPGDILVVPPRDATRRVLVVGEVRTPVNLPYRNGITVLDAFVAAGGGTEYADLDGVQVARMEGGKKVELVVDIGRMLKRGDLSRNMPLAPGDIVVVPR